VIVEGEVEPQKGYLIDYGEISAAVEPIVKQLDHYYLNEIEGLGNPTSEVLAGWLFERIKVRLPVLSAVVVRETCTTACEYRG
jgi:6-pyruvoyltetrahydropterin/6-carboxytetrahydropterin synthase